MEYSPTIANKEIFDLDKEWVKLITEAKNIGLSLEELKTFLLTQGSSKKFLF